MCKRKKKMFEKLLRCLKKFFEKLCNKYINYFSGFTFGKFFT